MGDQCSSEQLDRGAARVRTRGVPVRMKPNQVGRGGAWESKHWTRLGSNTESQAFRCLVLLYFWKWAKDDFLFFGFKRPNLVEQDGRAPQNLGHTLNYPNRTSYAQDMGTLHPWLYKGFQRWFPRTAGPKDPVIVE